jgi:hypothetical protein
MGGHIVSTLTIDLLAALRSVCFLLVEAE